MLKRSSSRATGAAGGGSPGFDGAGGGTAGGGLNDDPSPCASVSDAIPAGADVDVAGSGFPSSPTGAVRGPRPRMRVVKPYDTKLRWLYASRSSNRNPSPWMLASQSTPGCRGWMPASCKLAQEGRMREKCGRPVGG